MDFSTLARRELQALCKKNKIPANITNVAMVDALNALEIVEGVEELLKPAESKMENSSIESPGKSAHTQQSVPRTGYSTRQKPVREENESPQNLTRTRIGGTRRRITRDVEEAVTITPAVRSSRKKATVVQLKEREEAQKNGDQMDKGAAQNTLRMGTRVSTVDEKSKTVQRVYSTRKSVRLSEKKVVELNSMDKEMTQPIKLDSFSEDMGEVSENTVEHGSNLPTASENCSESKDDSQALVGQKSEVSGDAKSFASAPTNVMDLLVDSQMQEAKTSFTEEIDITDLVIEEAEKSESDASNMSNNPKLDTAQDVSEEQSSVNVTANDAETYLVPNEVQEQSNNGNVSADVVKTYPVPSEVKEQSNGNVSAEENFEIRDLELSFAADDNFSGRGKENNDEPEVDSNQFGGEITSNNELNSEKSLGADDFSFQNEVTNIIDFVGPKDDTTEKPESEPTLEAADKPMSEESDFSTDSELDTEEPVTEESEREAEVDFSPQEEDTVLRSSVGPIWKTEAEPTNGEFSAKSDRTPASVKQLNQIKGSVASLIMEDDPVPNPSPLKKSSSKTPLSARRMAARVLDDKENIDHSGRKLELTKEKKKKAKKENSLKEVSLRQLSKMLKEKLQISNNTVMNNEEENVAKVVKMRPALQALPEKVNSRQRIE
ncbi:hypothetical protein LguiA_031696 [Lonicera macranthoides]